jgi:hypothetical protein
MRNSLIAVFLTSFSFVNRPQETGEYVINCYPLQGSPKRPKNLLAMEAESLKLRHQKISVSNWYFNLWITICICCLCFWLNQARVVKCIDVSPYVTFMLLDYFMITPMWSCTVVRVSLRFIFFPFYGFLTLSWTLVKVGVPIPLIFVVN